MSTSLLQLDKSTSLLQLVNKLVTSLLSRQLVNKLWDFYVCRAVHLDLVPDNTSQSIVKRFKQFIRRRETPSLVISNNEKTLLTMKEKNYGRLKTWWLGEGYYSHYQSLKIMCQHKQETTQLNEESRKKNCARTLLEVIEFRIFNATSWAPPTRPKRRSCYQLGDVVSVKEYNVKRLNWQIALVNELIKGRDGEVRAAVVRKMDKAEQAKQESI